MRLWVFALCLGAAAPGRAATLDSFCADPADANFTRRCHEASRGLQIDEKAADVGLNLPKASRTRFIAIIAGRSYSREAISVCTALGDQEKVLMECMARAGIYYGLRAADARPIESKQKPSAAQIRVVSPIMTARAIDTAAALEALRHEPALLDRDRPAVPADGDRVVDRRELAGGNPLALDRRQIPVLDVPAPCPTGGAPAPHVAAGAASSPHPGPECRRSYVPSDGFYFGSTTGRILSVTNGHSDIDLDVIFFPYGLGSYVYGWSLYPGIVGGAMVHWRSRLPVFTEPPFAR